VPDTRELVRMVGNSPVGKAVLVTVLRGGAIKELTVVLARREEGERVVNTSVETQEPEATEMLGLTLSEINADLAAQFQLDPNMAGLVITALDPASDAAIKGLQVGDVITEAGQQPVATVADFAARIEEATAAGRKSLLLLVRRAGDPRFVALVFEP